MQSPTEIKLKFNLLRVLRKFGAVHLCLKMQARAKMANLAKNRERAKIEMRLQEELTLSRCTSVEHNNFWNLRLVQISRVILSYYIFGDRGTAGGDALWKCPSQK